MGVFKIPNKAASDWSTAADWWTNANTPTIHASTNMTITAGGIFSQTFVAPNSTESITGVLVYPVASWATRTVVFTLQANSVDTATNISITGNDVSLNQYLFVKLVTPYLQTSGVTYRWRISSAAGSPTIAQSSTASQVFGIITTDVTSAPVTGDSVFINTLNAATNVEVTIPNTAAVCGNNGTLSGSTAFASSNRYLDIALQVSGGAVGVASLKHATGADTKLELKNSVFMNTNGKYDDKPSAGFVAETAFTPGATLTNSLYWCWGSGSLCDVQGVGLATPSQWKTNFVSGLGTAASPAILVNGASVSVGDYLIFAPTATAGTNYNETEYRYVISKPTANQVVLSNTSGGVELALANTHTGGYVFNETAGKNVLWRSTDGNKWHMLFSNTSATTANTIFKWTRVRDVFSSTSAARGGIALTSGIPDIQYMSLGTPGTTTANQMMFLPTNNTNNLTLRGILAFNCNPSSSQDGTINVTAANKNFYDSHIIDVSSVGWKLIGANPYFDHCTAIACGKGGVGNLYAGWNMQVNSGQFVDCEQHSNRLQGILWYGSGADVIFTRFISGSLGTNGDFSAQASGQLSYQTAYFDTPTIAETNYVTGNTLMIQGSMIQFKDINGTPYNNWQFSANGNGRFTGPGLADTTAPTLGTYAVRRDPATSTGNKFTYRQLASPGAKFITFGRVWENAAYVADASATVTVDLYLPGLTPGVDTPTATTTMTKTATKTAPAANFLLSGDYAGSVASDATIVVTFKNPLGTAGLQGYVGDLLNSENDTTKFKNVYRGQTEDVMPLGLGADPTASAAIYATTFWSDTTTYGAGTKGKNVKDASKAKLLL